MISLAGKCALVTGGSAGLGAAVCEQLAAEGVNVAINYAHSRERAEELAQKLRNEHKVKVFVIQSDLFSGREAAEKTVADAYEAMGQLDMVVSNAGWTKVVPYSDLDSLDEGVWDMCLQANIKTHFFLFRAAKPHLEKSQDGGTFIVSASVAGRATQGSSIAYAVSKAGLIHMVKMLAKTLGPRVRLHAVCPGLLLTDWGRSFPQAAIDDMTERSPLKVTTDVDETAAHFVFLCKMASSTGSVVAMDAGISL